MWDSKLNEIVEKLKEKHGVSEFLIKDAVEHMFSQVKKCMQDPSMPKILLHNFGTFRPRMFLINSKLAWFKKRLTAGTLNQEEYDQKTKKLINVKNRLTQENERRTQ